MTTAQGQTLRCIGLVIEAVCILGLLGVARGKLGDWPGFPVDPAFFLRACLGVGVVVWLAGTIGIYSGRKKPMPDDQ